MPLPEDIIERVCTPSEIRWAENRSCPSLAGWFTLFFSGKETVYKALSRLVPVEIEFHDLWLSFQPAERSFVARFVKKGLLGARYGSGLIGRFDWDDRHVATALTIIRDG